MFALGGGHRDTEVGPPGGTTDNLGLLTPAEIKKTMTRVVCHSLGFHGFFAFTHR